jgi:hypothetical protein
MKTTLLLLTILMTTAAFAQYGSYGYISAQPQIYNPPDHPAHASFAPIAAGTTLYPGTSYTMAQGERPASDFPQTATASLGDVARELKKQHDALPNKSKVVWVNQ